MDSGSGIRGLGSGMKKFSNPDSWSGTICTIWKPENGIEKRSKFKPSYWSTGTGIGKHSVAIRIIFFAGTRAGAASIYTNFWILHYTVRFNDREMDRCRNRIIFTSQSCNKLCGSAKLSTRHVPGSYHLIKGAGQSSAHPAIRAAAQAVLISVAVGLQQLDDVLLPGRRCCCHHYT
jgi:hypothetical protein